MIRKRTLHASLLCGVAAAVLAGAGQASAQQARFDIDPQPLSSALTAFSEQSQTSIIFSPALTSAKTTSGFEGAADVQLALNNLLAGSGLTWRRDGETYVIVRADAAPQSGSAAGDGAEVEALIVTAQKREQQIQDVPIAISAFTMEQLDAQKIEGGFDLLKGVPNVSFSKTNFTSYNFQIRGIGTQAVSATTDPGVAVAMNNTTLIVNRLFEQEYVDIERVEVLRGPQGTLYGRNATGGVINVITAKPRMGDFFGEVKLETGNYNAQRLRAHINIPLGETLAVRLAGAMTKRDGYGVNLAADDPDLANPPQRDFDDRNLWTGRVTLGWEPTESLRVNLMWERFNEDDRRVRSAKQLCARDEGRTAFGGSDWTDDPLRGPQIARLTTQGCLPESLYSESSFDTPNGDAIPFLTVLRETGYTVYTGEIAFNSTGGIGFNPDFRNPDAECLLESFFRPAGAAAWGMSPLDRCVDVFASRTQSADMREIYSIIEPRYTASSDIFELSIDHDLSDALTLSSQTLYLEDELYSTQDVNRFEPSSGVFNESATACATVLYVLAPFGAFPCNAGQFPGTYRVNGEGEFLRYADFTRDGIFCDPQLGCSDTVLMQDVARGYSRQFNQEFRLASSFDGPVNFSLGANYTRFQTEQDYFVFSNLITALTLSPPFNGWNHLCTTQGQLCVYTDPNPLGSINGEGHNYFRSSNPYKLNSAAAFGELYWEVTPTVQLTAGLRLTWDRKVFTPRPSQTLLAFYGEIPAEGADTALPELCENLRCSMTGNARGGRGYPADADIVQEWREPTGRLGVDWQPDLGFTDESLFYAFFTRGYKGGGANPPSIAKPAGMLIERAQGAVISRTFDPEYVNAYEIGSKNTLLRGALTLNGSAFYYDYTDYQVSKIVDRSAANENFDAEIWGLEMEALFAPTRNLRFNLALGYLQTRIADGEQSIDLMDRTQGSELSYTTSNGTTFNDWIVLKPAAHQSSNCVAPAQLVSAVIDGPVGQINAGVLNYLITGFCPGGNLVGFVGFGDSDFTAPLIPGYGAYDARIDAPNGGAGFFADLSGNELPNAPHWTAALGAQYTMTLPGGWDATLRGDFYWQAESYARVYNTEYDRLREWTNTNVSLWFEQPDWGVTAEVYVKNAFDETPITGAFLNADDAALTTNIFTLDPRLIGVSVRKSF